MPTLPLKPRVRIYEIYSPMGEELWGEINTFDITEIFKMGKTIHITREEIIAPASKGGKLREVLNTKGNYRPAFLRFDIKIGDQHPDCGVPTQPPYVNLKFYRFKLYFIILFF